MLKVILHAPNVIMPFCEPARELRLQNAPLWLWQRNLLAPYVTRELELKKGMPMPQVHEPTLAYRDNLFFDEPYIRTFIVEAKKRKRAVRAAFSADDPASESFEGLSHHCHTACEQIVVQSDIQQKSRAESSG